MSILVSMIAIKTLWASDITGTWTAQMIEKNAKPVEATFVFNVEGKKLTGTMITSMEDESAPLMEGEVSGNKVSFKTMQDFEDYTITFIYTGRIKGDTITFTVAGISGKGPTKTFTAKKADN